MYARKKSATSCPLSLSAVSRLLRKLKWPALAARAKPPPLVFVSYVAIDGVSQ